MDKELAHIKREVPVVIKGLERGLKELGSIVYPAVRDVRALKKAGSGEYADAILDRNGFGGDTAEIYFHRFAPQGSPHPTDRGLYQALMDDPEKSKAYHEACYQRWAGGVKAVQRIIQKYGGTIQVNGIHLDEYLKAVKDSGETPDHRVHVKISVPGQDKLRTLRQLIEK